MPPRYAYWTILIDNKATAFRAREREELLPTFNQLARRNADIVMKYFARGRLWETPEQARWAAMNPAPRREKRGEAWRPGGVHKDPRARFGKEAKFDKPRRFDKSDRFDKLAGPGGPTAPSSTSGDRRGDAGAERPGNPRTRSGSVSGRSGSGEWRAGTPARRPSNGQRRPKDAPTRSDRGKTRFYGPKGRPQKPR